MQTTTTTNHLTNTLKTLGGTCNEYMAGTVAWNDGTRGVDANGNLSAFGSNITDARIMAKDGAHMPYVRPHNMDEKLGITTADKINFVRKDGTSVTAQEILENLEEHCSYAGYKTMDAKVDKKQKIIVRVQSTFVPLKHDETERKVAPGHYSYQTSSKDDPCNMIITGTSQGIFAHSDDVGINNLFAHTIEDDGNVNNHWFEATPTEHSVGGIQIEEEDEEEKCEKKAKKAKTMNLGFEKMGKRCNTFLVLSFERQRRPAICFRGGLSGSVDSESEDENVCRSVGAVYRSMMGVASAARMSIDEEVVGVRAATEIDAIRLDYTPIMLNILNYYTIKAEGETDGVTVEPTDVAMAVGDMENIYKMCDATGKLSELPVMLKKLNKETMEGIRHKIVTDPPMKKDPYEFNANATKACM